MGEAPSLLLVLGQSCSRGPWGGAVRGPRLLSKARPVRSREERGDSKSSVEGVPHSVLPKSSARSCRQVGRRGTAEGLNPLPLRALVRPYAPQPRPTRPSPASSATLAPTCSRSTPPSRGPPPPSTSSGPPYTRHVAPNNRLARPRPLPGRSLSWIRSSERLPRSSPSRPRSTASLPRCVPGVRSVHRATCTVDPLGALAGPRRLLAARSEPLPSPAHPRSPVVARTRSGCAEAVRPLLLRANPP